MEEGNKEKEGKDQVSRQAQVLQEPTNPEPLWFHLQKS